ncbi:MAG: DUF3833 family protein [Caulobacteraceae bacterium]
MDGSSSFVGNSDFRPEVFFVGRTEGAAVLKGAFGQIRRRCSIVTEGDWNFAKHSLEFRETFIYDNGAIDTWLWATQIGANGTYVSAEALAGPGVVGRRLKGDYVLSFKRPCGAFKGLFTPHFVIRFTPLDSQTVLMAARFSLFGVPIGSMTGIHRRVAP